MHAYVRVYTGNYLLRLTALHYDDDDDASSHAMMMMMTMVVTILIMMLLPSHLSIHSYNHDCSEDRGGSERQEISARQ